MSRISTLLLMPLILTLLSPSLVLGKELKVHTFDSKGTKIAYTDSGEGPAVVFLHGMTGNRTNFKRLGEQTVKAGFRVVALDARGHGLSSKPTKPEAYGVELAHDVIRLLDHLKIEQCHLVGYSMGGDIANKVREQHPKRLLSVVLGGVGRGVAKGWSSNDFDQLVLARSMKEGHGMKALLRQPGAVRPGKISEEEVAKLNATLMTDQKSEALVALLRAYGRLEVSDESLIKNKVPVLVIVGEFDAEKPTADEWKGRMKNMTFVPIPKKNHFEAAGTEMFRAKIISFLKDPKSPADQKPPKPLRQLSWLIGVWKHENPDSYNKVDGLEIRWGGSKSTIEIRYTYYFYPGFCENADYRCTETVAVNDAGQLIVRFKYKLLAGKAFNLAPMELAGEYKLEQKKANEWRGSGPFQKYSNKKRTGAGRTDLTVVKRGDETFALTSARATVSERDYKFTFRKRNPK